MCETIHTPVYDYLPGRGHRDQWHSHRSTLSHTPLPWSVSITTTSLYNQNTPCAHPLVFLTEKNHLKCILYVLDTVNTNKICINIKGMCQGGCI